MSRTVGIVYADLELSNPRNRVLHPMRVRALADTGSLHLCISEHIAQQLELETLYEREVTLADGTRRLCRYVGPIQLRFTERRQGFTGAFVIGSGVLLGAIPMEDLDLVVDPARQRVIANPDTPNIPGSIAMPACANVYPRVAN